MTILDLINKSSIMLNISEVLNAELGDITTENENEVLANNFALKRLYEFSKIVINEINSHSPTVVQVEYEATNNQIPLSAFERLSKIISVKNQYGYSKYSQVGDCIKVAQNGRYVVEYRQYPEINSILSPIEMDNDIITEDILVYGLNAYYCLATGLFNEFNVYNEHYTNKLNRLKNLKVFAMPCRSWQ